MDSLLRLQRSIGFKNITPQFDNSAKYSELRYEVLMTLKGKPQYSCLN